MKTISAANANRQFSAILREAAQGEAFLITSRGRPVATLVPATGISAKAREDLLARLKARTPMGERRWSRDELYEDPE